MQWINTYIGLHLQAAHASLRKLWCNPLLTFSTILTITATLFLPTILLAIASNIDKFVLNLQQKNNINLYLKLSISPNGARDFLMEIQNMTGVGQARLISAADGLIELQHQSDMVDIIHNLTDNPLPAVITVIPSSDFNTAVKLEKLYKRLKKYPEVEQVKLDLSWINRLSAIISFVALLIRSLIVLFIAAVFLIISNTLLVAIYRGYEEIRVLKLIGAKDSFVIRPFLYMGLCYGLAGAVFAIFLVKIFIYVLGLVANPLFASYRLADVICGLSIKDMVLLLLFSPILACFGTWLAVKKQLSHISL